jgi:hypothetical protein
MRMACDCAVVSAGLVAVDRVLPATVRVTLRAATARTVTTLVRVAPAARSPSEKHRVRPERVAPPVRVTTRFCGRLRQEVTDVAVAVPVLVVRMARRIAWPLVTRVRLGSTVGLRVVAVVAVVVLVVVEVAAPAGVTAFDGADAGEVPAALVAVAVKL